MHSATFRNPPRLITFDFDGTLANTFPVFLDIFDDLADKYRFRPFERHNLQYLRGLDAQEILKHHKVPFWQLPQLSREFRQRMERRLSSVTLFAGIDAVLRELSAAPVQIGIASSNSYANAIQLLGAIHTDSLRYFEYGVSLFGKTAKLRSILARCKCRPSETILIGDEIRDADAAAAAGIPFAAVAWGYNHLNALLSHGASLAISRVEEIPSKLFDL
jgi:phosphoglycolate phosphatase